MTKEEFRGFGVGSQKDMILEALVRVTKDLEIMQNESGKPFTGTAKQRQNDLKLMTILADSFVKNELVWKWPTDLNDAIKESRDTKKAIEDERIGTKQVHIGCSGSDRMTMKQFIAERFNKKL